MFMRRLRQLSDNKLKRGGVAGIVVGVSALLLCELPIVLALVGLGGGVFTFSSSLTFQLAAFGVVGLGVLAVLVHRRRTAHAA